MFISLIFLVNQVQLQKKKKKKKVLLLKLTKKYKVSQSEFT